MAQDNEPRARRNLWTELRCLGHEQRMDGRRISRKLTYENHALVLTIS